MRHHLYDGHILDDRDKLRAAGASGVGVRGMGRGPVGASYQGRQGVNVQV